MLCFKNNTDPPPPSGIKNIGILENTVFFLMNAYILIKIHPPDLKIKHMIMYTI